MKCKTKDDRGEVALKIDINKAYDWVDWGFIHAMMMKIDFHDKWIIWIMQCVTSAIYFVLVNNDKVGPIIPARGLR